MSSVIHLIHTNDIHSQFEQWPRVVRGINRIREKCRQRNEAYLLLDIGDHMDRSHIITEGTAGRANVDLLNKVGYHYSTIGNNEGITFSKRMLNDVYTEAQFDILLCNLRDGDGRPPWLLPSTIHLLDGIQIGLVGATAPFYPFYGQLGWQTTEPIEAIHEQVQQMRGRVDAIVVLSHLGLATDQKLAQQVPGVDVILGGHSHHILPEGMQANRTVITQCGRGGKYVGHVKMTANTATYWDIEASCVPVEAEEEDSCTVSLLVDWLTYSSEQLQQTVTSLAEALPVDWENESAFPNFLADSLTKWCGTSIALANAGLLLDGLDQGVVTKQDIHRICPHPINPCRMWLTGEEIWDVLQQSLDPAIQTFRLKGCGFRGTQVGMMAVSGLRVYYRAEGPRKVIESIEHAGKALCPTVQYEVASVDMLTFSTLFEPLHRATAVDYLMPDFLRDMLVHTLSAEPFSSTYQRRWVECG